MNMNAFPSKSLRCSIAFAALALAISSTGLHAQEIGRIQAVEALPDGKRSAPTDVDLTGYWVSIVTEDWRWRMLTPAKGDYQSVPVNETGRKAGDLWDPAKDEAAGEQCKSYAAPAIMRVPGRFHITWQDDRTLKVESDAGQQTRLFHFGDWKAPAGPPEWQGESRAAWQTPRRPPAVNGVVETGPSKYGTLRVATTRIRPGYLRKNGIPFSPDAVLTEYWDINREPNGDQWLVVTTIVHDPKYLYQDWYTSLHFRREANGAKWDPQPCTARW